MKNPSNEITNLTIDKFLEGLIKLYDNNKPVFKLIEVEITPEDKIEIKEAIDKRNNANLQRGVMGIKKYQRPEDKKVDDKGLTGEIMFNKVLKQIYSNAPVPNYKIKTPAVALTGALDHSTQDYVIENLSQLATFDVKGQCEIKVPGTKYEPSLNVNMEALERMKKQNGLFMIAGLIDCDEKHFENAKTIKFYYIDVEYFEKSSRAVFPRSEQSTPFRALPIRNINQEAGRSLKM